MCALREFALHPPLHPNDYSYSYLVNERATPSLLSGSGHTCNVVVIVIMLL